MSSLQNAAPTSSLSINFAPISPDPDPEPINKKKHNQMASESGALVLLEGFILLQAKVTSFLPPCLDQWKQIEATQCSIQTSTPVLASLLITIFTAFAKIMLLFLHRGNKCKKCGWCMLTPRPFQPACLLRSLVQTCIG